MEGPKNINDWKQLDTKHVHVVFRMETIWSFRFKFIGVCVSSIEQLRMEISHEAAAVVNSGEQAENPRTCCLGTLPVHVCCSGSDW